MCVCKCTSVFICICIYICIYRLLCCFDIVCSKLRCKRHISPCDRCTQVRQQRVLSIRDEASKTSRRRPGDRCWNPPARNKGTSPTGLFVTMSQSSLMEALVLSSLKNRSLTAAQCIELPTNDDNSITKASMRQRAPCFFCRLMINVLVV